jgi:hypothetical protein
MSRTPARVTQADVARALRAVEQCGYPGIVEIARDGTIRIVPIGLERQAPEPEPLDDDEPIEL